MKKIKRTPQGTPIVPKDFHDWYEEIKDRWGRDSENSEHFALLKICQLGFGHGLEDALNRKLPAHSGSLTRWVSDHKSEAVESIMNGYVVEEEPKYYLDLPKIGMVNEFSNNQLNWTNCEGGITENAIKSIDERYWPFAVPVEKV